MPKFNRKKNEFAMWSAKAKLYLAIKFLSPTLLASFKDSLPANEQVELDLTKPDELAKNKCKAMNLHVMNLLTVMMADNDPMLMMVESVKNKEWSNGLGYIFWEKPIKKFEPSDQVTKGEQTAKLLSLKLKKGEDLSELELRIALLELKYEIPLNVEMKIAAVMKATGNEYSDTLQSETHMIEKAGGTVTYDNLIQAMTESFRIYGSKDDSDSDKDVDVGLSVLSFKGKCYICGKE